jgi:23S rRNA-/tRNA-specific pseudouridylate synthase
MQQRLPVTRIKLTPITGRTHQLRVHCAAIGHPILGDPTYGVYGEASPNGGFENDDVDLLIPSSSSMDLQLSLNQYVKENEQVMCLHARELRITHPHSGNAMVFQDTPAF